MLRRGLSIGIAAVVAAAAPAAALPGPPHHGFRPPAQQLVCESWQFRRQTCVADTRGGVRLLQQTGGLCVHGQTWGTTPRGVWVTNGCRAIFAVVGGPGGGSGVPAGRLIVCESWQYRPAGCAAHVVRRPRIEVIAGTCVEHRSWGWDRRGLWVSHGCRARFLV